MPKIATAGNTNAMSAGGALPQRQPVFQARQIHNATSANARRTHNPKFVSQNWKNGAITPFHVFCAIVHKNGTSVPKSFGPIRKNGALKSAESCTQPGCHLSSDFARNRSLTSQTKRVGG